MPREQTSGNQQQERYEGHNVVERCSIRLRQWRGIAKQMRIDVRLTLAEAQS